MSTRHRRVRNPQASPVTSINAPIPNGHSSDTPPPPAAPLAIHFRLPFYDLTTQFFLEFYGISLKPPEGDTAPFSRSEINPSFIASGNAGAAVRTFDRFSQLQLWWSILYLHLHLSPARDMRSFALLSCVLCIFFSVMTNLLFFPFYL